MKRWDTIEVGGSPMRTDVAWPEGNGAASAILVAQHGADVDRFIEDRVERSPPRAFWPRRPISIIASPPTAPT